ncbi:transposase [Tissierella sp.]|uniref:transposase n=1 Tax=Tissierella sp. TaxID=41274 RepID=UPI0028B0E848|nr:transposase [Tissierella sp.]
MNQYYGIITSCLLYGSKAEIPNSGENREAFSDSSNQHGKCEVRALASCMFDVFNHFFLDLQIHSIKASESELPKQNINAVKEILRDIPFIIVFDRGYPPIEFVHFLEKEGTKYLFLLSSNAYKQERELMTKQDEPVKLIHTSPSLAKIKKNHPEVVKELKINGHTYTKIISSILPSDNEIALISNLPFQISGEEIKNLYFKRWEIEKNTIH